ncbi:MAG: hypothetical protein ACE5EW_06105 [Thermoplasmata archaeon]
MESDPGHQRNGPHRPTLTEWLVGLIPLPFVVVALILAAFMAEFGVRLGVYLDTWDLNEALASLPGPPWLAAVRLALGMAVFFLIIWTTRYMRRQVVAAEEDVLPLLPGGEERYHSAFGRISGYGPPLLIGVLLFLILAVPGGPLLGGPWTLIMSLIAAGLQVPLVGSFIWVYLRANVGLYILGKGSLNLKVYHEDPMLGLRPLGSLSLALAGPFLGVTAVMALWISVNPILRFQTTLYGFIAALAVIGVVMFFLPLYASHVTMVRERERVRGSVHSQAVEWLKKADVPEREALEATPADMMTLLSRLNKASFLDWAERRISEIHDWPFDTRIIGRLAALTLSIVVVLLTRYAATLFGV